MLQEEQAIDELLDPAKPGSVDDTIKVFPDESRVDERKTSGRRHRALLKTIITRFKAWVLALVTPLQSDIAAINEVLNMPPPPPHDVKWKFEPTVVIEAGQVKVGAGLALWKGPELSFLPQEFPIEALIDNTKIRLDMVYATENGQYALLKGEEGMVATRKALPDGALWVRDVVVKGEGTVVGAPGTVAIEAYLQSLPGFGPLKVLSIDQQGRLYWGAGGTAPQEPENQAPTVSAGADQTITEGLAIALVGTASDADGTIVSREWTQVSGPSTATISNPTEDSTPITNVVPGVYVFRFTATDNEGATAFDEVTITIEAGNAIPTVSAGPDQNVSEGTVVTLSGSASDSDGTIASYAWAQVSGPAVTLNNANTATATTPALAPGAYVFRLTATDNEGASNSDEVTITVTSATPNSGPPTNPTNDNQSGDTHVDVQPGDTLANFEIEYL